MEKLLFELFSECSIRENFQIYCPGCGGTRAVVELLQLHFWKSFCYNPIPIGILVDFLINIITISMEKYQGEKYKYIRIHIRSKQAVLMVLFLFFVVRNLLLYGYGIDMLGDLRGKVL